MSFDLLNPYACYVYERCLEDRCSTRDDFFLSYFQIGVARLMIMEVQDPCY
jgi:hypothetical protein